MSLTKFLLEPAPASAGARLSGQGASPRGVLTRSLLVFALGILVQPALRAQVEPAESLKVEIKRGAGDVHRPGDAPTTITVVVTTEVGAPQGGAKVTLQAQEKGPSVLFNGQRTITVKTDDSGVASITGVRGNNVKGGVVIAGDAEFEGKTGHFMINHVNASRPFWTKRNSGIVLGVLATVGVVLWQILKPGPPSATIESPTSSTRTLTVVPGSAPSAARR